MNRPRPAMVGCAIGLVTLAVTGWLYAVRHEGGPMPGATGGGICMERMGHTDFVTGGAFFRNEASEPARITKVELIQADGLRLVEAPVVPNGAIGTARGWPPSVEGWDRRQPAVGALIPPDDQDGVEHWFVALRLTPTDQRAEPSFTGIRFEYRVGHRRYYTEGDIRFRVSDNHCQNFS